ncbi:MAG: response regulator transcription factor [Acidimicrobiales bacterium]
MITVMIVDDHAIVRNGLERLFETADDIEVVALASNGQEAVDLADRLHPDVILMDLSMPVMDGVEATRQITSTDSTSRIVVLTSFGDESRILDALNAGAGGYLLKHIDPDELLSAVRSASAGEAPLDPRVGRLLLETRMSPQPRPNELTAREAEVLALVGKGLANKQIARQLGISERTVKAHLTSVFHRLDVTDRVQAALWAQQNLPPS